MTQVSRYDMTLCRRGLAASEVFPATAAGRDAGRRARERTMRTKEVPQSKRARTGTIESRSDLTREAVLEISSELRSLLADVFAIYVKTKNFHWHMSGRHFRDHHLLLDEQADQIYAMTDVIAERARKLGGTTIHSIGEIARLQRLEDSDADGPAPAQMLSELRADNLRLTG